MSDDPILAKEVGAVLKSRANSQEKPSDSDLLPVYRYLVPSSTTSASSNASEKKDIHWYCEKAKSDLHREAATYLIFLFAFQRQGTSKAWVDRLEEILLGCEGCARSFGGARRKLGLKYLSKWPSHVRVNFFAAVDRWQSALILKEVDDAAKTSYGSSSSSQPALYTLSRPSLQLFLSEPSLLNDPGLTPLVDQAVSSPSFSPSITSSGLSPVLVRLLSSPDTIKRKWAFSQLSSASRRPVSFSNWCLLGIGHEVQELYNGNLDVTEQEKWGIIETLLKERVLDSQTIEQGLLGGQHEEDSKGKTGRGLMSAISVLLGSVIPQFPEVKARKWRMMVVLAG
ncbi:uncharacterized protein L201_002395 [Kwoniella dendrophila CBS 6074]|uniref:Helicase Sen1 N-terminal domain-containing protein n=1 Tax=Kwoniella dendrophila CBS 6074 TaxID=1295534 RepID=A0AAX4JQ21_9TREE